MAKGDLPTMLKNATVTMDDSVNVEDTRMLDGEASDPQFLKDSNTTQQYKTPALKSGDLGGRNNLNG